VKVSDLVQYDDKYVERDIGVVMRSWIQYRYNTEVHLVDILWKEGEIVTHYATDFTVISES
jgi:hypothetical protein